MMQSNLNYRKLSQDSKGYTINEIDNMLDQYNDNMELYRLLKDTEYKKKADNIIKLLKGSN